MPAADHFQQFREHTLLKHAIFRRYVQRWAPILTFHFKQMRIVDACAGCGRDTTGAPGSPLIAIEEAEKTQQFMREKHRKNVTIQVVAIEKDPRNFDELVSLVRDPHRAVQGTLADYIDRLEPSFAGVPHLFFIDPFGLEPLRADVVRRALSGPRNEVFLLFADVAALRHVGVVDAVQPAEHMHGDLFGQLPAPERVPTKVLKRTAEASERIMDAAYGGFDWRRARRSRQAMLELYCEMLRDAGAEHILPIPILNARGQHKYHLIYATHSGVGHGVMKYALDKGLRDSLLTARPEQIIRLGTQVSVERLAEMVRIRFAGQTVQWADAVRDYALEKTPAMPEQLEGLKQSLRPERLPGRKVVFSFRSQSSAE